MKDKMGPLEESLAASTNYMQGSDQEREALDKSYVIQDRIQKELSGLQEQMVPAGGYLLVVCVELLVFDTDTFLL
jgi:hypothetical protein